MSFARPKKIIKSFKTEAVVLCGDEEFGKLGQLSRVWQGVLACGCTGCERQDFGSRGLHGWPVWENSPVPGGHSCYQLAWQWVTPTHCTPKLQLIKGVYGTSAQVYFRKGGRC